MVTADRPVLSSATRPFTGIRQRVLLAVLAATLAVATQRPPAEPRPVETGYLNTTVEIGGERFRLACQGNGDATVVFLELAGTWPAQIWIRAQTWTATFARVCVIFATSGSGRAAMVAPALTDRIAGDLAGALEDQQVPTPYVIVATAALAPVAVSLVDGNAGVINGGLVIEPASDPVTGSIIEPGGTSRAVTLTDLKQIEEAIRSLF
jgi:hypothetical protein